MPQSSEPVFVPAPPLPPGPRHALIIATSRYDDSGLRQLRSPVRDAEDFAAVLADPEIGGFAVTTLIDRTEPEIRRALAAFLDGHSPDETILVYLSCHGIQDRRGRLYFAATDTISKYPHASAIRAAELLDELDECRARRQVIVLDCCFSGSFADHKGGPDIERHLAGHSRGREVLTASRGFEYSLEGKPVGDEITGSVFTTGLVKGLRSGAADANKDGYIVVEDAYKYAFQYVRESGADQTPQHWLFGGEGDRIIFARSAVGRSVMPARLPEYFTSALESGSPHVRIGAVNALAEWLTDPDPARNLAAKRVLREVARDDIRRVADVANSHLAEVFTPMTAAVVLRGHTEAVASVSFSPEGSWLASGSRDGTVRVWDTTTGSVRHTRSYGQPVSCVLVVGTPGAPARLWEVVVIAGGRVSRDVICGPEFGTAVIEDDYCTASIIGQRDYEVCFAGLDAKGAVVQGVVGAGTSPGRVARVSQAEDLAFSPDGTQLAVIDNGRARLINLSAANKETSLEDVEESARQAAFSLNGQLLAISHADGSIRICRTKTGSQRQVIRSPGGAVGAIAFSADGLRIAAASEDYIIREWDVATGAAARSMEGHAGQVAKVVYSPDGRMLASAGDDGTIRLWP